MVSVSPFIGAERAPFPYHILPAQVSTAAVCTQELQTPGTSLEDPGGLEPSPLSFPYPMGTLSYPGPLASLCTLHPEVALPHSCLASQGPVLGFPPPGLITCVLAAQSAPQSHLAAA